MLFKTSHTMHMFFSLVCCTSGPMSSLRHDIQVHSVFFFGVLYIWTNVITQARYPSSQCHNGIIQVLRLGIMTMFEPCHHRETTIHSQPSIRDCMTIWSTGGGGGFHLSAAHSARQDMCQDAIYSKTYHTNSCQKSSVYLWVSFFLYSVSNSGRKPTTRLFTQTGHECRRRCQLLQQETVNR